MHICDAILPEWVNSLTCEIMRWHAIRWMLFEVEEGGWEMLEIMAETRYRYTNQGSQLAQYDNFALHLLF